MQLKSGKITSDNIMLFAIVLLVLLTCLPITMCLPGIARNLLQIIAMASFFIGLAKSKDKSMLALFILIVAIMGLRVYEVWQYKSGLVSCVFNVYSGWAFAFYGFSLYKENDKEKCRKIFLFLIILLSIVAITTIIGIQKYPLAVRELGRKTASYSGLRGDDFSALKFEYRIMNIAGWNLLYGMVYVVPAVLYAFMKSKKKYLLVSMFLIELCIVFSQLTFAVLLSIALIVMCVVRPSMQKHVFALDAILVMIGIFAVINLDSIVLLMVTITGGMGMVMLSNKLNDLFLLLNGVNSGDALSRTEVYSKSLEVFEKHPVFGQSIYGIPGPDMFSFHSDFFDMIAYYGLFGLLLTVIGIVIYYRFISRTSAPKWLTFVLFMGFLGMYVFNPVWYSPQIFIGTFMMPALLSVILPESEGINTSADLKSNYLQNI